MHAREAESLAQEQRIHGITGDTTMLTSKAELAAKRATKLELATAIAALCMTAVPLGGALAQGGSRQISAGRAAAIHECSVLASRYTQHDWGNTEIYQYRACMARHGQPE
jgi:hypothetical protein